MWGCSGTPAQCHHRPARPKCPKIHTPHWPLGRPLGRPILDWTSSGISILFPSQSVVAQRGQNKRLKARNSHDAPSHVEGKHALQFPRPSSCLKNPFTLHVPPRRQRRRDEVELDPCLQPVSTPTHWTPSGSLPLRIDTISSYLLVSTATCPNPPPVPNTKGPTHYVHRTLSLYKDHKLQGHNVTMHTPDLSIKYPCHSHLKLAATTEANKHIQHQTTQQSTTHTF